MYYGKQNINFEFLVKEDDGSIGFLERSIKERDLWVIFSSNHNLEYTFHVWSPFRVGDVSRLEKCKKDLPKSTHYSQKY